MKKNFEDYFEDYLIKKKLKVQVAKNCIKANGMDGKITIIEKVLKKFNMLFNFHLFIRQNYDFFKAFNRNSNGNRHEWES